MSMLFKRIKDWATSITSFRTGDVLPVDGPSGTAKMSKDDLLRITAQNALADNLAPNFSTSVSYVSGDYVVYEGKLYIFTSDHAAGAWVGTDAQKVNGNDAFYHAINGHGNTDGSTPLHVIRAPVKTGHIYAVILRSTWNVSDISDGVNVLYVQYNFGSSALLVKKEDFSANKLFYTFTASQDNQVNVSVRGNADEYVSITLVDVTFAKLLFDKEQYLNYAAVYSGAVTLNGSTVVFTDNQNITLKAGHTYTFTTENSLDISEISSDARVMFIQKSDGSATIAGVYQADAVGLDYLILTVTPTQDVSVRVGFRGKVGDVCYLNVTDISNIDFRPINEILASQSADLAHIYNVSQEVTLTGSTPVFINLPSSMLTVGKTFRVTISPSPWNVSDLDADTNVFIIDDFHSEKYGQTKASSFTSPIDVSFSPTSVKNYRIILRGNSGVKIHVWMQEYMETENVDIVVDDMLSPSISFFESIGVIGASFESGIVYKNSSTSMGANYPKSWPQILAREKGIDVTNFSYGGADSKTWLTNASYGLPALNTDTDKELYIVNLGSNDSYHYGNDYIGTEADIGTDADTFFGNMSKIIDAIQTKAPNARIIIAEIRTNTEGSSANYNAAIRELATHYSLPTVVPYEEPFYSTVTYTTFVGGHPLYMGYAGMAKAWCRMVEGCMANNLSYFNHIPE